MKYILSKDVSLVGSSPKDYDHSVGFHDIKPFNSNNDDLLLVHRFPIKNILFSNKIETEICLWNYKNSKIMGFIIVNLFIDTINIFYFF